MKHLIIATTVAFGLFCVGGDSVAQDQTQATNMRKVTVTQEPARYEIYLADLHTGYQLEALVGNTHRQYMHARRVAERLEGLRMRGLALQPMVVVAIDDSSAPGMASQIQLSNAVHDPIAIVNVYCKQHVSSGSAHCRLAPLAIGAHSDNQRLAARQVGQLQQLQVAEVDLHH